MKGNTLPYFLTISPTICQIKMKMKKMKKYKKKLVGEFIHIKLKENFKKNCLENSFI